MVIGCEPHAPHAILTGMGGSASGLGLCVLDAVSSLALALHSD